MAAGEQEKFSKSWRSCDAQKKLKKSCGSGFLHHPSLADGVHDKYQYTPFSEVLGLFYTELNSLSGRVWGKSWMGP